MLLRKCEWERVTEETNIKAALELEGNGKYEIQTNIPFLDHMLSAFTKHSGFNLKLEAKGDSEIDFHHTIEDCGIALGEVFLKALGNKGGIERFGCGTTALDEALTRVVVDLSGRPYLYFGLEFCRNDDGSGVNPYLFEEFFRGFVNGGKLTMHIDQIRGKNSHHILESTFKSLAKALKQAVRITGFVTEIPSTKGVL